MLKPMLILGLAIAAASASAQAGGRTALTSDQIAFRQTGDMVERCSAARLDVQARFTAQCDATDGVLKNCHAVSAPAASKASLAQYSRYAQCLGEYIHVKPGVSGSVYLNLETPE